VTMFKSVTEHCISGTVCIMLHWGVLHVMYRWFCYWFKRRHRKWPNKIRIAKMRTILNIR